MTKPKRRPPPSYLCVRRGAIHYRYRMVVSHAGRTAERWIFQRSDHPDDWRASLEAVQVHRTRTREEMLRELQAEEIAVARSLMPTVGDLAARWLDDATARGVRVDVETYRVKVLTASLGADRRADLLTPEEIAGWLERLRADRKLGPAGANGYLALLKMALQLAVNRQLIASNPAAAIRPLPVHRGRPETLSTRQVSAIFAALDDLETPIPMRGLVLLGYYTLARTKDVRALRWEDVDLEAGTVTYRQTKNARRLRHPVVAPLRAPVRTFLAERLKDAGWIFPNPETGRPYRDVRRPWRKLIGLANAKLPEAERIPLTFRLYNLRHTGASHLAASGAMSALEIAQLMGDTRVETIERRYFALDTARLRAGMERAATDPELALIDNAAMGQRMGQGGDTNGHGEPSPDVPGSTAIL